MRILYVPLVIFAYAILSTQADWLSREITGYPEIFPRKGYPEKNSWWSFVTKKQLWKVLFIFGDSKL